MWQSGLFLSLHSLLALPLHSFLGGSRGDLGTKKTRWKSFQHNNCIRQDRGDQAVVINVPKIWESPSTKVYSLLCCMSMGIWRRLCSMSSALGTQVVDAASSGMMLGVGGWKGRGRQRESLSTNWLLKSVSDFISWSKSHDQSMGWVSMILS